MQHFWASGLGVYLQGVVSSPVFDQGSAMQGGRAISGLLNEFWESATTGDALFGGTELGLRQKEFGRQWPKQYLTGARNSKNLVCQDCMQSELPWKHI